MNWYCWGMRNTYKWMREACAAAFFKPEVSARYDISHLFSLNVSAVFKWSTKLITRLKLLPWVIGWIMSRQFFNQWKKKKPKLITPCMCDFFSRALSKFQVIAVIAVTPTGKASFVYSYVQTRLKGQYNGKWPFSLVSVLKPLITPIRAIAKNSDWFIALSVPVLIGRSNYFDIGFSTVIRKPLYDARGVTELLCKPLKKRERAWNVFFSFIVNFSSLHYSLRFAVYSLF